MTFIQVPNAALDADFSSGDKDASAAFPGMSVKPKKPTKSRFGFGSSGGKVKVRFHDCLYHCPQTNVRPFNQWNRFFAMSLT